MQIIRQDDLVHNVTRVLQIFKKSKCDIKPHFLLTGPSGSGKTFTIQALAKQLDIGFLEINAAQLTKEGLPGNSLSKALTPLLQFANIPTIVFVDEFDKLLISGNSNSQLAGESSNGIQNEFLIILESAKTSVFGDYGKYIDVSVKNTLFIFAGAFNGEENMDLNRLRELGVKTEFLGRVGLVYNTLPLTRESLHAIVDSNDLLDTYCTLFKKEADKESIAEEIKNHLDSNFDLNTIGARLVKTLIHQYFISGSLG